MTVAWVAGTPLSESEVDSREAAVRAGRASAVLPAADSSEGRQLRRWLVQLIAAERLVVREAAAGDGAPAAGDAPDLAELAEDNAALLELGSVAATLLAQNADARRVFAAVTAHVVIAPERVDAYYRANPERFAVPERRTVRHAVLASPGDDPRLAERAPRTTKRGELTGPVEDAVFAARAGDTVGPLRDPLGWHVIAVDTVEPARHRPIGEVRAEIERRLLGPARRRAFTAWLDGRAAEMVRLTPGYEHPGDPSQPDNTHRH